MIELYISVLTETQMLLLDCPAHGLPQSKLCANQHCCDLLCDLCLTFHTERTAHTTAIFLNAHSLAFFQVFTQKIHSVMLRWGNTVRREGIGAVFVVRGEDACSGDMTIIEEEVKEMVATVLEEHGRLMANNCNFAASNLNSPMLYHPEFLKDLFNLIVHPWTVNAQLILNKLNRFLTQIQETSQGKAICFQLRKEAAAQIQTFRRELLSKEQNGLVWHSGQERGEKSEESNTTGSSAGSGGDFSREEREVSQFHLSNLPQSIKIIESYKLIEQSACPLKDSSSTNTKIQTQNASQITIPKQSTKNESLSADSMSNLLEQKHQLLKQNCFLEKENLSLREQVQDLKQKCLKMPLQRSQHSTSSIKYRESDLNGELVGELVQLEAELTDTRHDMQVLVEYINSLSKQRIIDPLEFKCKMRTLKTLLMH